MKPEAILIKLTSKQHAALPLIASGMSSLEVSKSIGVKASTISEWLHHSPQFIQALTEIRSETVIRTREAIESLALRSIEELAALLKNSKSETIRLKTCELILTKLYFPDIERPVDKQSITGEFDLSLILKGLGYDQN